MKFAAEFPDYPEADMPALPAGFEDTSWHNDACPSYSNAHYQIWIDYADTALREYGDKYPRFNVQPMRDGIEITGNGGLTTDDWDAVLAYIAKCQWFALCDNPAITTEPHPILGAVPICQRCADKVHNLKGK